MQDYLKNKKVVVTGAAGFLGSHLVDQLLKFKAEVVGIDNLLTGRIKNLDQAKVNPNFTFVQANAAESPLLYLPENFVPDLVLHFASPASPPRYQEYPIETYLINSTGCHVWLSYLRQHNPSGRFLFASTSEVYGDPLVHPQPETYWGNVNPNGVRSCYDEGKRLGETICGVFERDFDLDVRIVRIFNTYGPRIDPDDGRVIPNFIKQALAGENLTIYGDGQQTRSYCYVSDLVEGILKLASIQNGKGQTVNLGNPIEKTVLETAKAIAQATNHSPDFIYQDLPGDDPTRRQPDISKASELLNWQPKVDFETGLKDTIDHFKLYE